jgi:hypothetical protein
MRASLLAFAFMLGGFAAAAAAMPARPIGTDPLVHDVQWSCTQERCIDQRTGAWTQSQCDGYGCRRLGEAPRQLRNRIPAYRDDGFDPRPRRRGWDGGHRGRGGFDCNASRCIDGNGAVWESTCDRRGCRPLRPARGQRW